MPRNRATTTVIPTDPNDFYAAVRSLGATPPRVDPLSPEFQAAFDNRPPMPPRVDCTAYDAGMQAVREHAAREAADILPLPLPPGISPWVAADYAPPNEAGVQGRARRQSHREGMGGPTPARPAPAVAHHSTVHPSLFTPLIPSDEQAEKLRVLMEAARQFVDTLDAALPQAAGRIEMFDRLRELMFWARESILRYPDGEPRPPAGDYTPFGAYPTVAPSQQPPDAHPGDRYMDPVTFAIRTAR